MRIFAFSVFLHLIAATHITANQNPEKVFTDIYENAGWGRNAMGEGFSGYGSTLENTRFYIKFIEDFVVANQIKTIVDLGCGDWTFSKYINWGKAQYTGIDVVKKVIDENNKLYSGPGIRFIVSDFLQNEIPAADLLICKDVLMHLTNHDVEIVLKKLGKFKHCLFTHNVEPDNLSAQNIEISRGDFRAIDLTKDPFNLGAVKIINYFTDHSVKQIVYYGKGK